MDIGTIRGLLTAALLILFVWVVVWSFSRHRRSDFDAASKLPLNDASPAPRNTDEEQKQ